MADIPTVTTSEIELVYGDPNANESVKKVAIGLLNDFMELAYANRETPYTTGKTVLPSGTTIEDVDKALADAATSEKFKLVFAKISETYKSGDLTPQSKNNGYWDPKWTPVLVLVSFNK